MNETLHGEPKSDVRLTTSVHRVPVPATSMLPGSEKAPPAAVNLLNQAVQWARAAVDQMFPAHLGAVVVAAILLSACSKTPTLPPAPLTTPVQGATAPTTTGAADKSVPEASSVLPPAVATKVDPAAGRTNSAMSREQESSTMPIPGQNNDHSAPLTPAKRASGP